MFEGSKMKKRLLIVTSLLLAGSCLQAMELDKKRESTREDCKVEDMSKLNGESSEHEKVKNGMSDVSRREKSLNDKILALEKKKKFLRKENRILKEVEKRSGKELNALYKKVLLEKCFFIDK